MSIPIISSIKNLFIVTSQDKSLIHWILMHTPLSKMYIFNTFVGGYFFTIFILLLLYGVTPIILKNIKKI